MDTVLFCFYIGTRKTRMTASFFDQIYASRISTSKAPHKPTSFQIMFTKRKIFSNVRKIIVV